MTEKVSRTYLGDGLYANDDGFQFELSTERYGQRHVVYLEDDVALALLKFIERARGIKITIDRGMNEKQ